MMCCRAANELPTSAISPRPPGVRPRTERKGAVVGSDPGGRVAVLISGRGSNLQAIIDAIAQGRLDARIAVVVANRAGAAGLERARAAGIETMTIIHRDYPTREAFEDVLVRELRARGVSLICLAGFMRLLGPTFLDAFPNAILNIHPSVLPSFPGVDAQKQALLHGVKVAGATVHFVTGELDGGPIIHQGTVAVKGTIDTVRAAYGNCSLEEVFVKITGVTE